VEGNTPARQNGAARPHAVDGVGQRGFVKQHGLHTAEQAAAAQELAARIGDLGLRTIRLTVVDQHGVPRSKSLSPDVAIAAMSNGLGAERTGRRQQPRGEPDGRAGRQPVPVPGGQPRGRAGRDQPQAGAPAPGRGRPVRGGAAMLPTSLADAVGALVEDQFFRGAFGDVMVDYLVQMKRAELARYDAAVAQNPPPDGQDISDWEMREYFEFF
jgi:hypothetical protein